MDFIYFILFLVALAYFFLQIIERFIFFSLGILVKGEIIHFNNILKRNSKIISFRAI